MGFIDELRSYKRDGRPVHFREAVDLIEKAANTIEELVTALETITSKANRKEPITFEYQNKMRALCKKARGVG